MDNFVRDFRDEPVFTNVVNSIPKLNEDLSGESFKILHLNICSINKNFDGLLCFLQQISTSINVIVLTETHKIYDLQMFNMFGYKIIYNEGTYNKCDGVVVLMKENLKYSHKFKNIGEVRCIELEIGETKNKVCVTCIYRSPAIDERVFLESFADYLYSGKHIKSHIITGDINFDILKNDMQKTEEYKTILASFGFTSYINKYTRPISKTCLDHFFVKGDQNLKKNRFLCHKLQNNRSLSHFNFINQRLQ